MGAKLFADLVDVAREDYLRFVDEGDVFAEAFDRVHIVG